MRTFVMTGRVYRPKRKLALHCDAFWLRQAASQAQQAWFGLTWMISAVWYALVDVRRAFVRWEQVRTKDRTDQSYRTDRTHETEFNDAVADGCYAGGYAYTDLHTLRMLPKEGGAI